MKVVERHCVAALNALTAQSMKQLVPSLGIPADLVLVFDGVSIGARQFSRYESLLLVGLVFLEGGTCLAPHAQPANCASARP